MHHNSSEIMNPILVSGSHRSGSTWVGRVISFSPDVGYIHEPFNLNHRVGINSYQFVQWFPYASDCSNISALEKSLNQCLKFEYQWKKEVRDIRTGRDAVRMLRDGSLFSYHKLMRHRPLSKDPIAIFSTEWLVETYGMSPVIIIRHPAAFVSSLKKAGWEFPFNDLLGQPRLMEKLSDFKVDIEKMAIDNGTSIIKQGVLLWNIIHFVIYDYKVNHPDWYFCRHEDLSRNPLAEFKKIYEYLNLDYSEAIQSRIVGSSSTGNKQEASRPDDIKIDSLNNVFSWKNRLEDNEIEYVHKHTVQIASLFYSKDDW